MKQLFFTLSVFLLTFAANASINPITGATSVCTTITITLSDTSPVTDTSYSKTWTSHNTAIATVDSNGVVTGIATGTDSIFYSIGTDSTWVVITVNGPTPISGPPVTCVGTYNVMTGGTSAGTWLSTAPSLATVTGDTGTVHAVAPGVVTIVYTNVTGCNSGFTMTINPDPAAVAGSSTICGIGGTDSLSDPVPGGTWQVAFSPLATISTSGLVTALDTGLELVYYSTSPVAGCTVNKWVTIVSSGCSPGSLSGGYAWLTHTSCGSDDVLSLTGATAGCGIGYQWQYSYDNLAWSDLAGYTTSSSPVMLSNAMFYRCKVICIASGDSAISTSVYAAKVSNSIHTIVTQNDSTCGGVHFYISSCDSSIPFNLNIYYGDGTSDNLYLTYGGAGGDTGRSFHAYGSPGIYTIKEVLLDGSVPVDSISYPYEYFACYSLPLNIYYDYNGNCTKDSIEPFSVIPVTLRVDSDGIIIDTISVVSGAYYKAFGSPGDSYRFTLINPPAGMVASCSDNISYTLGTSPTNSVTQAIGISCADSSGIFDLAGTYTSICGRHWSDGYIYTGNSHCTPVNALVTLRYSPKYSFTWAAPSPDSTSGNLLMWHLPGVSSSDALLRQIRYHFDHSGTFLTVGDTVQYFCSITPIVGDSDTINNTIIVVDTVKGSFDPNDIFVTPQGFILAGAPLQYTINFENTGNDTAHDIYVMDTLSDNVDPHTVQILSVSAPMNIATLTAGGHHILKFDFPNINLLDSSHHGQCDGMVTFKVKSLPGLADSATIYNHAGIFFDDNPVVMTDTVLNMVNYIYSNDSVCVGSMDSFYTGVAGGTWHTADPGISLSGGNATGVAAGVDTVYYSVGYGKDTITISRAINVLPLAIPGMISGPVYVCAGSVITMSETVSGGIWNLTNGNSMILDSTLGIIMGITEGYDSVVYTATNNCGPVSVYYPDTIINTLAPAGVVSGPDNLCAGSVGLYSDPVSLPPATYGNWYMTSSFYASVSGGTVSALTPGSDSVAYVVSNVCGNDTAYMPITIVTLPYAGILSGFDSLCVGSTLSVMATMSGGSWSITNGMATIDSGMVTGVSVGLDTVLYSISNVCGSDSTSMSVYVNVPLSSGTITGASSLCQGSSISFSDSIPSGNWSVSNSVLATIDGGGNLMASAAGTDTIYYTVTTYCGTAVSQAVASILPLPYAGIITGHDTVCTSGHTSFVDTVSGGTWISTNTGLATVAGNIVSGVANGTDTILYRYTNSCGSDTARFPILVYSTPNPMITGLPATLCEGVLESLTGSPSGGAWITSNDSVVTIGTGTIIGMVPGLDTITYVFTDLCGSKVSRTVTTVLTAPTVHITAPRNDTLCIGHHDIDTVQLSPTGGVWTMLNYSVTADTTIITAVSGGMDTLVYRASNACGTGTDTIRILVYSREVCDSISYVPELPGMFNDGFLVYPNPANDIVTIQILDGHYASAEIHLTDMLGKTERTYLATGSNNLFQVNTGNLPRGNYLLQVFSGNKTWRTTVTLW